MSIRILLARILVLLFFSLSLYAFDFNSLKKNSDADAKKNDFNYELLKKNSDASANKNDSMNEHLYESEYKNISKNIMRTLNLVKVDEKYKNEIKKALKKEFGKNKQLYIFLFTSKSVPESNVINFTKGIDVLNHNGVDIKGRIVFNGREKNKPIQSIMNDFNITTAKNTIATINPLMFMDLNLTKVPAYVISECPEDFKSLECVHKYIVKGDIPFEKFLDILNTKKTEYKGLYFKLVTPE